MEKRPKKIQCPKCFTINPEDTSYCNKCGYNLEKAKDTLYFVPTKEYEEDTIYFSPGDNFGDRYRIIEELGKGGMGTVYKAKDKDLDITVALKMIHPKYSADSRVIKRFKKEILLSRSISHENIIRIHDLGEINDIKYISMDFIKGQNLKELIHTSRSLTIETTLSITKQICESLKAAHQKGIVHRDLKPQNIMIDNNGKVYTMDFGVAKSIEGQETSVAGAIIGTPQYMSPEQAKGETIDYRSDIYSLGIIIYEMLTGEQPFEADTLAGYIQKHTQEQPPSPTDTNPLVPPFLEKIIFKCLEKTKENRYQSVEEICRELERQKAMPETVSYRSKKSPLSRISIVVVPILIIAIAIGMYLLIGRKKPEPFLPEGGLKSIVVMYFENNTGEEKFDHLRKGICHLIISDLLQSKYLRVISSDRLYDILKQLNLLNAKSYSTQDLKKVASLGYANNVLYGNYIKAGDIIRLNATLHGGELGEIISSTSINIEGEDEIISIADQLTPWVKAELDLTRYEITSDIDREVREITTSSPKALELYIEGFRLYHERKYMESITILEKALTIDPEFAMAYNLIASCYEYAGGYPDKVRENLQKALAQERISLRESYLIRAAYLNVYEKDYDKAIETYLELLNIYPEDEKGIMNLGAIYRNLEEWDTALELYEKALTLNKRSDTTYLNFAYLFMAKGLYDKAHEILLENKDVFPYKAVYHWILAHVYICQSRYDLALSEIDKATAIDPKNHEYIATKGQIYHLMDDFPQAEELYIQLLTKESPYSQFLGRYWKSQLYLIQGQYSKCRKEVALGIEHAQKSGLKTSELDFLLFLAYLNLKQKHFTKALDVLNQTIEISHESRLEDRQKLAHHLCGLTYLQMNKMNEAKNTAIQLKQLVEKTGNKKHMRHYYDLMGQIALKTNQPDKALNYFNKAFDLLSFQIYTLKNQSFFIDSLASAYYETDDIENARRYYEKITSLTISRLRWGDIFTRSYYMLGKIYQKKGWTGKAIECYDKFIQLWQDADPGLSETADAKKQLALLNQEPES